MEEFAALGAAVCGVSVDAVERHADFAREQRLPYALLSDRGGRVAARYGSLWNLGVAQIAKRNTFLIDPDGRVAKVYIGVNPSRNAGHVLDDLRRMSGK